MSTNIAGGKMDPEWRCIYYWTCWYSTAMLLYQRVQYIITTWCVSHDFLQTRDHNDKPFPYPTNPKKNNKNPMASLISHQWPSNDLRNSWGSSPKSGAGVLLVTSLGFFAEVSLPLISLGLPKGKDRSGKNSCFFCGVAVQTTEVYSRYPMWISNMFQDEGYTFRATSIGHLLL